MVLFSQIDICKFLKVSSPTQDVTLKLPPLCGWHTVGGQVEFTLAHLNPNANFPYFKLFRMDFQSTPQV